ncbi:MAG TPA: stage III sporulation protein AD [Candidatus Blautia merdavium]|uniref:Stage III sporulation protein AD n=1 Tax=Candidatus Blautia merdavium TaxID=2838494 RepID=A0A9D2PP13_9FIRM|nr:stage III sporulation protein AD [Candidatus Blautia merdavium]
MEIVKVAALGMTGMLLGLLLKETKPEYSVYLSLAAGILIFSYMAGKLEYLFDSVLKIQEYLPLDTKYLTTLLKMIGITYIGQFSSGLCRDAGYGTLAAQIEVFAKLYIMVLSMPVLLALMEAIHGFLS